MLALAVFNALDKHNVKISKSCGRVYIYKKIEKKLNGLFFPAQREETKKAI